MTPGYFKPLRRKIGVVTLMLGCAFAGVWLRSLVINDFIQIPSEDSYSSLDSKAGTVSFLKSTGHDLANPSSRVNRWSWRSTTIKPPDENSRYWFETPRYQSIRNWKCFGFAIDDSRWSLSQRSGMLSTRTVPYWSIVVPLTLLCAWLLLSKPRAGKQRFLREVRVH